MAINPSILSIGAGGHARSVLNLLQRHGVYSPIGFVDSVNSPGSKVCGLEVLGSEADINCIFQRHSLSHCLVAVGDNFSREAITLRLKKKFPNIIFPALVDPSAVVASDAILESGVIVFAQAHVGPGCTLSQGSIANTKSSLDHDCTLNAYASLAPGAISGGHVHIGARSFIGLGTCVVQNVRIGSDTVVGAGSLVLNDLPDGIVSYGSPAKVVRSRLPHASYL